MNAGFRELVGVDCLGNECEAPQCGILAPGAFWALEGDVEIRGRVRADGAALSIDELDIDRLVPPAKR